MTDEFKHLTSRLFKSNSSKTGILWEIFELQRTRNPIYKSFSNSFIDRHKRPESIDEIPLLPIRAFKESHLIVDQLEPELQFRSSGTGQGTRSRHLVASTDLYKKTIHKGFERYFDPDQFAILCYAPGYSDNPESSLLWMMNELIQSDPTGLSRFLPLGNPLTKSDFEPALEKGKNILLFGAAFGLLDLIDLKSAKLPDEANIIETGGMKTYRQSVTKEELRKRISDGFEVPGENIHSEYGMCELMSQMYAVGSEWFEPQPWVHLSVRDPSDPFRHCKPGEEGKIGVIDLANLFSCPFLLTEDRGVMNEDGHLAVLGRWHGAELRGCNFLLEQD